MTFFNVALCQLNPCHSMAANLAKSLKACEKAKKLGAHIALFPELWQLGYDTSQMKQSNAITETHPFIKAHIKLAKTLGIAIGVTYLKATQTKPQNALMIIDATGRVLIDYAKVHICDFEGGTERVLSPGNQFFVEKLPFDGGEVKIGTMICMDREFPESARTLSLKGAEVILVPNACPIATCTALGDARLAGLRALAYENLVGVAMANYPAPNQDGHSAAYDNLGKQMLLADKSEGIFMAGFDLAALRSVREQEWPCRGASKRRPETYTLYR